MKSRCRNDRQCGKLIVVRLVGFKAWHFLTCLSLLPDLPALGLPSPLLATPPSSDVQRHVSRPTDATPPPALFMWQLWSRPRRGAPSRKEMRRKTKKSSKPSTPSCACLGRGAVPEEVSVLCQLRTGGSGKEGVVLAEALWQRSCVQALLNTACLLRHVGHSCCKRRTPWENELTKTYGGCICFPKPFRQPF